MGKLMVWADSVDLVHELLHLTKCALKRLQVVSKIWKWHTRNVVGASRERGAGKPQYDSDGATLNNIQYHI